MWVGGWGKMASNRAKVRVSPAWLGQWMLNWLSKVRLDEVYIAKTNTAKMY